MNPLDLIAGATPDDEDFYGVRSQPQPPIAVILVGDPIIDHFLRNSMLALLPAWPLPNRPEPCH